MHYIFLYIMISKTTSIFVKQVKRFKSIYVNHDKVIFHNKSMKFIERKTIFNLINAYNGMNEYILIYIIIPIYTEKSFLYIHRHLSLA